MYYVVYSSRLLILIQERKRWVKKLALFRWLAFWTTMTGLVILTAYCWQIGLPLLIIVGVPLNTLYVWHMEFCEQLPAGDPFLRK